MEGIKSPELNLSECYAIANVGFVECHPADSVATWDYASRAPVWSLRQAADCAMPAHSREQESSTSTRIFRHEYVATTAAASAKEHFVLGTVRRARSGFDVVPQCIAKPREINLLGWPWQSFRRCPLAASQVYVAIGGPAWRPSATAP